jgi:hypothetical protein
MPIHPFFIFISSLLSCLPLPHLSDSVVLNPNASNTLSLELKPGMTFTIGTSRFAVLGLFLPLLSATRQSQFFWRANLNFKYGQTSGPTALWMVVGAPKLSILSSSLTLVLKYSHLASNKRIYNKFVQFHHYARCKGQLITNSYYFRKPHDVSFQCICYPVALLCPVAFVFLSSSKSSLDS